MKIVLKRSSFIITLLMVVILSAGVSLANPGEVTNIGADTENISGDNAGVKISEYDKTLGQLKEKLNAIRDMESENKFTDVEEHWAKSTILKMSAIGVFKGYEDDTFRPNAPITQAEIVNLATRITNDDEVKQTDDLTQNHLSDVPDWAKESVQKAVYKGIISLNQFHSCIQAGRVQAAVIIAKSINLQAQDPTDIPFNDKFLISPEDVGYIMALYQKGIIKGTPDGKFNPNSPITRAEMSIIMERVIDDFGEDNASAPVTAHAATHIVLPRENLCLIGQKFGVSYQEIMSANNLKSSLIYPGMSLYIPTPTNIAAKQQPSSQVSRGGYFQRPANEDADLLSRLITAEAEAEPYEGKVAVGAVVLNRVDSPDFPNSIRDVIYQHEHGTYQFGPVKSGRIDRPASLESINAANDALNGSDPTEGAIYFFPKYIKNSWFWSRPLSRIIGNHVFTY